MKIDWYQNFETALNKLIQFSKQTLKDDLDKAGLIQGFEFSFEQCWKAIQKKAGMEGVRIASPKSAFSWALQAGLIPQSDESLWLDMLQDRNLTSHTYREEIANQVIRRIQSTYVAALTSLLKQMKLRAT